MPITKKYDKECTCKNKKIFKDCKVENVERHLDRIKLGLVQI